MIEQQWRFSWKLKSVKSAFIVFLLIFCVFVYSAQWSVTVQKMTFASYENFEVHSYGKPFDIKFQKYLQQFGLIESSPEEKNIELFDPKDIVFVTYASSNHFHESKAGLRNWRNLTENKIVYYDLGLTADQADEVKKLCNVEYVKFNFNLYPAHVKTLTTYAFKPILTAEVYSKHKTFWIMDASVRFLDVRKLAEFYDAVNKKLFEPYTITYKADHSIYAATQPGTHVYLPLPPGQAKLEMYAATIQFVHASSFSREVVKWNLLCALTQECIAPKGNNLFCKFTKDRYKDFAHCHRFDQSSLNIVHLAVLQKYGYEPAKNRTTFRSFMDIRRGEKYGRRLNFNCK